MAELRSGRLNDKKCTVHGLEVRGLNPGRVVLGVHSTAV